MELTATATATCFLSFRIEEPLSFPHLSPAARRPCPVPAPLAARCLLPVRRPCPVPALLATRRLLATRSPCTVPDARRLLAAALALSPLRAVRSPPACPVPTARRPLAAVFVLL